MGVATITYTDFGFINSLATYTCDPGLDLISGDQVRQCFGPSWSGTEPVCRAVACPPLPFPSNGVVACSGLSTPSVDGAFLEVCNTTCHPGYSLVGSLERTCLGDSTWSGPVSFCSDFVIGNSYALNIAPAYTGIPAGSTVSYDVRVGDSADNAIGTGSDVPLARVVGGDGSNAAAVAGFDTITKLYDTDLTVSTLVGTYTYQLGLNGLLFTQGPTQTVVSVVPAAASALQTTLAQDANVIEFETDTPVSFQVTIRDTYGNAVLTSPAASSWYVAFRIGATETPVPPSSFSFAGSTFEFTTSVTSGGTYQLVVRLDEADIVGSPFVTLVSATCTPGSKVFSDTDCTECETSSYSSSINAVECTPCPEFTTGPSGSSSFLNCTCLPTTWYGPGQREEGRPCVPCPFGATCPGGDQAPVSAPGFEPSDDGSAFVQCPRPASCTGSGTCARGYTGRLCSSCSDGYYRLGEECLKCKDSNSLIIAALVLAVFVFVTCIVWINTKNTKVYGYASFVIALNTLQFLAIYGTIQLEWPAVARVVMNAASLVNLNLDLASPECGLSVGDPYMFKWIMTMALPFFFLLPFALVVLVMSVVFNHRSRKQSAEKGSTHSRTSLWRVNTVVFHAAGRGYLQTLLLLYLPLMYAALRFVDCTNVGKGIVVMTANPQTRCYTSNWYSLLPLVLVVAALYGTSIPGVLLWFMLRQRKRLDEITFAAKYAFLVAKYRDALFWYEVVVLGRKLLIVVLVCAFRSPAVKALLTATSLLCMVAGARLLDHMPYAEPHHNLIENATHFVGGLLLMFGTVTASTLLRDVMVIAAIIGLLLIILGGIGYEIWRIRQRDQEDMASFFDVNALSGEEEVVMDEDQSAIDMACFGSEVLVSSTTHSLTSPPSGMDSEQFGSYVDPPVISPVTSVVLSPPSSIGASM